MGEARHTAGMTDNVEGEGWRIVRPGPEELAQSVAIDDLIPNAAWFWRPLQRFCVPECCGLDAYDFSAEAVAWACGWSATPPEPGAWRAGEAERGGAKGLADELRAAATSIRDLEAKAASAGLFNDILTPESYASLLEDLAGKAAPPRS